MKEQSHKDEMSAALRGDFQRLRARGVAATLVPHESAAHAPEPVADDAAVPAEEPAPAVEPPTPPRRAVSEPQEPAPETPAVEPSPTPDEAPELSRPGTWRGAGAPALGLARAARRPLTRSR